MYGSLTNGAFVEHWDGQAWRTEPVPHTKVGRIKGAGPNGSDILLDYTLQSVSCPTADMCLSVGNEHDGGLGGQTVVRWTGSRWKQQPIKLPTFKIGVPEGIWAVSCTSARFCMAVGGGSFVISYRWNGHRWTRAQAPQLSKPGRFSREPGLDDVACTSSTDCVATGFLSLLGGPGLVGRWNGRSWRISRSTGQATRATCDPFAHCVLTP